MGQLSGTGVITGMNNSMGDIMNDAAGTTDDNTARPATDHPFEAPWHAEAFALVIGLYDAGLFSWQEWADTLAGRLADDSNAGSLDGSDDYYAAWLAALEILLQRRQITAGPKEIESVMAGWRQAYLETPHGIPVRLQR